MSTTLKIILSLVVVLGLTCAGGGYYLWKTYGATMMAEGQEAWNAGEAFAASTDNNGCVSTAASRYPADSGMRTVMKQGVFLQGCLPKSTVTPGFCDGVPSTSDQTATNAWLQKRCPEIGTGDPRCIVVATPIQSFCNPTRTG